jgi:hypothetical protein
VKDLHGSRPVGASTLAVLGSTYAHSVLATSVHYYTPLRRALDLKQQRCPRQVPALFLSTILLFIPASVFLVGLWLRCLRADRVLRVLARAVFALSALVLEVDGLAPADAHRSLAVHHSFNP